MKPNYHTRRDNAFLGRLVEALYNLTEELAQCQEVITKQDLNNLETSLTMKLSEIKAQVAQAATRSTEAFAELGVKISDLQSQIDALLTAAQDPEVTDETFLADLNTVKANVDQLADIVPDAVEPV